MNKDRRSRIAKCLEEIQDIRDQEQDAFDNMPGPIQESEKGQAMEENIAHLEEAIEALENIE